MRFGIIGCGLIGNKRALSLAGKHSLAAVADLDLAKAQALAAAHPGCQAFADPLAVARHPGVEAVVVATLHGALAPLSLAALAAGKHVLVEKPAARNAGEFRPVVAEAEARGLCLKVGYNHRFHPALREAKRILQGAGPVLYVRARYGHGGRLGYEKEWRAQRALSGGGELIDQGLHLIDLSRMLMGDFKEAQGYLPTLFWDMGVEDNAFLLLKTADGRPAWLHATWMEWKNTFSLEAETRGLKVQVDGLGGSYGAETLTVHRMKPEMGPPETERMEFKGPDQSWALELEEFCAAIAEGRRPEADGRDGLAALELAFQVYAQAGIKEGS
jgi:predicted dehydrogenase